MYIFSSKLNLVKIIDWNFLSRSRKFTKLKAKLLIDDYQTDSKSQKTFTSASAFILCERNISM